MTPLPKGPRKDVLVKMLFLLDEFEICFSGGGAYASGVRSFMAALLYSCLFGRRVRRAFCSRFLLVRIVCLLLSFSANSLLQRVLRSP